MDKAKWVDDQEPVHSRRMQFLPIAWDLLPW